MSTPQLLLVTMLALIGAAIQGTIGFGLGMMTAPLLSLVDPAFVPGPVLIATVPITIAAILRERGHVDVSGFAVAMIGRVPGTIAGAAVAAFASPRLLSALLGTAVLLAVASTASRRRVRATRTTLVAAGAASGLMGTTTSIGGPPMALVYQHAPPPVIRSTLAAFFAAGTSLAIVSLAVAGAIGRHELHLAAWLLPGTLVGYALSGPFARRLDPRQTRLGVLTICTFAGLVLLARAVS